MGRESLVDNLTGELLGDIVAGRLVAGGSLPSEADLAVRFGVNRLTIREAVRKLQAQGIVHTVAGRRSEVNPISRWTDIGAALQVVEARIGPAESSIQLLQLRRMIETGACALAATRMDPAGLRRLEGEVDGMREAAAANDVAAYVVHDIAFHDVILDSCGNQFLRILLDPLQELLRERRTETSKVPAVQQHAIEMHTAVLEALRTQDAEIAYAAMSAHMDQTERDLIHYVL
ncbi:FadR/GntR family transcriptional regulator [Propionicicella superfundia]|uniref:FadR/GntR family transcriptional regulator n=1 Tax=Propionicicella superfundia TaxID=348582 RepID=UPI000412CA0B|nr:FCD domain-containing protein [Propionicicella superfundia]